MKRALVLAAAIAIVLGGVGVVTFAFFDRLVLAALAPSGPFDEEAAPPPPSYDDRANWSALPDRDDADDARVQGQLPIAPAAAAVDVFYVHPTSYVGRAWNARLDDAVVNDATDRGATRLQASAFRGSGAVWAPRYRQANLTAFTYPSEDGRKAIALAGDDVVAAFAWWQAHRSPSRPFVLAGHSQGAVHAFRVLKDVVAGSALQKQLVAAYLIGSAVTVDAVAATGVPVCGGEQQTGCVVAWNARGPRYHGGLDLVDPAMKGARVCVNPLTWRDDELPGERAQNRGAVFFGPGDDPPAPLPGFASARCQQGTLVVELSGIVPRDVLSRLLDHALGADNHHAYEVGLFWVNLRENVAVRTAAWSAAAATGAAREQGRPAEVAQPPR